MRLIFRSPYCNTLSKINSLTCLALAKKILIYVLIKYLLSTYYVLSPLPSSEDSAVNKTEKCPDFKELMFLCKVKQDFLKMEANKYICDRQLYML